MNYKKTNVSKERDEILIFGLGIFGVLAFPLKTNPLGISNSGRRSGSLKSTKILIESWRTTEELLGELLFLGGSVGSGPVPFTCLLLSSVHPRAVKFIE